MSIELTTDQEEYAEQWRNIIRSYINRTCLHNCLGGSGTFDNGDDDCEPKNND